jgi:hypothetical protein
MTRIRLKGSVIRSYLKLIASDGRTPALLEHVPPETKLLVATPPLASTWTDWKHMLALNAAIEELWGIAGVRDYSRRNIVDTRGFNAWMIESLLRLFGTSPPTILKRLNESIRSTCEGIEYNYIAGSERACSVESRYASDEPIPDSIFIGSIATLEEILRLCRVQGKVSEPERLTPNSARFSLRW